MGIKFLNKIWQERRYNDEVCIIWNSGLLRQQLADTHFFALVSSYLIRRETWENPAIESDIFKMVKKYVIYLALIQQFLQ